PRTEGGLHGILHERVKYAAKQLVQIIKASAVSYYGERAHRNSAVIEVSPHHMVEFPLALSWQLLASEVAETGGWLTE
ncbi:MAG: hypothetical protein WCF55_19015, partial [Pseudolabrys sp.]